MNRASICKRLHICAVLGGLAGFRLRTPMPGRMRMTGIRRKTKPQRQRAGCIVAILAGALAIATPLQAQTATGTILGNVKDNSGGAVPGASVTATNVNTQASRTTTTDADGQ